jgi:hypothetical protein
MQALFFILFLSVQSFAVTFEVRGKKQDLLFQTNSSTAVPVKLGQLTVNILDVGQIPYVGNSSGILKIFQLEQDVVVVSDTEMKAYGWCFSIDGLTPETMADQTEITDLNSKIIWCWAYAHYENGQWTGQCVKD